MAHERTRYGLSGEQRARHYLEQGGLQWRAANVRTRYGEVDLVMQDGPVLVFIEVKSRRTALSGHPAEAVTPPKLRHLVAVAHSYLGQIRHRGPWRIDVVAIAGDKVTHLADVTGLT